MRIAVCTLTEAPENIGVWSGTPSHFLEGLRALHADVVTIGPLAPGAYRAMNKIAGLTGRLGRKVNWEAEPSALRFFTRFLDRELERLKPDLVIVMGWYPLGSTSGVPILYWGDATVGQRINLAPHWSGLSKRTATRAAIVERMALSRLHKTIWASRWAENDATNRYALSNTAVAGFAANIPDPGRRQVSRNLHEIQLLSVGGKWHRKGLDRAVEIADCLHTKKISMHMNIVGVQPPDVSWERPYVTYHGHINKADSKGLTKLSALYSAADVFLLPTRNEPFGIVFQEAAAYAIPVVTSNVGGVPEVVQHGVTGLTLEADSSAEAYAKAVLFVLDEQNYRRMSQAARRRYESDFNWNASAKRILEICHQ